MIDNRGGGGGIIGANDVANSADGYIILLGSTTDAGPDSRRDGEPAVRSGEELFCHLGVRLQLDPIVINPPLPAHSLKELIAYAKANPGKLSYGSAGNASTPTWRVNCSSGWPEGSTSCTCLTRVLARASPM